MGDYRVVVDAVAAAETVGIALEAKSRVGRLSANQIKAELKRVRDNRDAAAGVLIAESLDSLPEGSGLAR